MSTEMFVRQNYEKRKPMKDIMNEINIDILLEKSTIKIESINNKVVIVVVRLEGGFVLIETSSFLDIDNFDEEIGVANCMNKIRKRLWELEAYRLQYEIE